MNQSDPWVGIIVGIVTGSFVTVLGQAAIYWREQYSETRKRQRRFLAFLMGWRSDLQRLDHRDNKTVWNAYLEKVGELYASWGEAFGDFSDDSFETLVERLGDLRYEEIVGIGKVTRTEIAHVLDPLIHLVKKEINWDHASKPSVPVFPNRVLGKL